MQRHAGRRIPFAGRSIRPIRLSDGAALHALASDPQLARASHVPLLAGTDACFAERAVEEWENATQFTFVVAKGDELRGSVLLEIDARRARLSYWIGRPFWNRGAATEAVREAIHFAFAQRRLEEVRAIAFHDNAASQRVLLKNGFTIAPPLETERDVQHALSGSSIVAYRLVRGDIAKGSIAVTLQALLDGYSKIYGMAPITLDANGMCRLCFRETIDIDIEPAKRPGHVHLYTVLGRIPPNADVAWYRMLQEANLFGRDTGFAATACDATTGEVVLCQLLDVETLTAERFDLLLQDFVQSADTLTTRLRDGAPRETSEAAFSDTIQMIRI